MKLTKKKKIIISTIVVVLAAGGIYIKTKAGNKEEPGVMVTTSPVTKKDIEENIQLKAPLEGTESVELVSKLHYEVVKLNVKEGDKVTKGQVLAVLDSSALEKEIAGLQDEIALAKTRLNETNESTSTAKNLAQLELEEKLKTSQKEYEDAVESLQDIQRQYDNMKVLVNAGAETKENLKAKELALSEAQRKVNDYTVQDGKVVATDAELKAVERAGISSAASDQKAIENSQRSLARKKEDLKDCEIRSTIDGTVTRVNIKLGRFADETDNDKPMFVIENIDKLQMKVLVSEYDIGKIKIGQDVEVSADILQDRTAKGVVARISPTGEEKTSGSTERVIPTQVDILSGSEGLIAGINAKATIVVAKSQNAMTVPIESVVQNPDGSTQLLRVNAESKLEAVPVTLGVENDLEVEVKGEGLKEGDAIVLAPEPYLTEGMTVISSGNVDNPQAQTEPEDETGVQVETESKDETESKEETEPKEETESKDETQTQSEAEK